MFKPLDSFGQIEQIQTTLKSKMYVTNLFKTKEQIDYLIAHNEIEYFTDEGFLFLLVKEAHFLRLFYACISPEALSNGCLAIQSILNSATTVIIETVGNCAQKVIISDILSKYGFGEYTNLFRMSKIRTVAVQYPETVLNHNIKKLGIDKKQELAQLFKNYFDPLAEQIPNDLELEKLINQECIYYYADGNEIEGFIIFEINGFTLHLRYWFVHPNYREKKIGSQLMNVLFSSGEKVRRELFWVINTNQNAIKRYKHFGFKEEDLLNTVYINKAIKYER